jgi:hypothetical protein
MSRNTLTRDDAVESIEAIRSVMDRTTRYTHISWLGIVIAGCAATATALSSWIWDVSPTHQAAAYLVLWGGALVAAFLGGWWTTARKARLAGESLWSRKLHVVMCGFLPAVALGAVLTALLAHIDRLDLAPGIWMGLYGVGILAVGYVLDWEFQFTGWAFLLSSATAFFLLRGAPHLSMLLAFGGIHLGLGAFRFFKEHPWPRS